MKYLLTIILVFAMLFLAGCFVTPIEPDPDPDPIPDPDIVCEGGIYCEDFDGLCFDEGCPEEVCYSEGTYWYNEDGRIFLIGDTVWPELPTDIYGSCPGRFLEEIFYE